MPKPQSVGIKCPGPGDKPCPTKSFRGPKGGRCKYCQAVRRRMTALAWARRALASGYYKKDAPKERIREEIQIARRAAGETTGIKGALSVIQAMQRMAL